MKSKLIIFILLAVTVIGITSCATSRSKYGCPAVASTGTFKG